jgi:hypothetical protein
MHIRACYSNNALVLSDLPRCVYIVVNALRREAFDETGAAVQERMRAILGQLKVCAFVVILRVQYQWEFVGTDSRVLFCRATNNCSLNVCNRWTRRIVIT